MTDAPTSQIDVLTGLANGVSFGRAEFTGSSAAGMRIASLSGERIARTTLEVGGKFLAIILDDYDPEVAVAVLMHAVTPDVGQT